MSSLPCKFLKGTFTDEIALGLAVCGDDIHNIFPLRHANNTLLQPFLLSLSAVKPYTFVCEARGKN